MSDMLFAKKVYVYVQTPVHTNVIVYKNYSEPFLFTGILTKAKYHVRTETNTESAM